MLKDENNLFIGEQGLDPDSAYIVQPYDQSSSNRRNLEEMIEEAEGLARAINLQIASTRVVPIKAIQAGSYFGKGVREDISKEIEELTPNLVIANCQLSPVQQRNLEKEWKTKVIDRTGLILEIFGARAQTKEGRLQVELAALDYQKSRLVRSWTHLERQRGGAGFMGGPGERQIELDRRIISQRMSKLKKELEQVRKTRDLGRKSRQRVPFPVVSFVGYTNAGKSTLFNQITDAGVFAEDLPFATLDPTMRKIELPNNQEAILADTVGFITDLPTHLVASFRATLEQITYGDVIVHVIDASQHDYKMQRDDVIEILEDLGVEYDRDRRIIEVYNKIDALEHDDLVDLKRHKMRSNTPPKVLISALKGQGIDTLMEEIAEVTAYNHNEETFSISVSNGRAIAWLYEHGEVIDQSESEDGMSINFTVRLSTQHKMQFQTEFLGMKTEKDD